MAGVDEGQYDEEEIAGQVTIINNDRWYNEGQAFLKTVSSFDNNSLKATQVHELLQEMWMRRHNAALELVYNSLNMPFDDDIPVGEWLNARNYPVENVRTTPWDKTPDILYFRFEEDGTQTLVIADVTVTNRVEEGKIKKMRNYTELANRITEVFNIKVILMPLSMSIDLTEAYSLVLDMRGQIDEEMYLKYSMLSKNLTASQAILRSKLIQTAFESHQLTDLINVSFNQDVMENRQKLESICKEIRKAGLDNHPEVDNNWTSEKMENTIKRVCSVFKEGPPDLPLVNLGSIDEAFNAMYREASSKYELKDVAGPSSQFTFGNGGFRQFTDTQTETLSTHTCKFLVHYLRQINIQEQIYDPAVAEYAQDIKDIIVYNWSDDLGALDKAKKPGLMLSTVAHIDMAKLKKKARKDIKDLKGADDILEEQLRQRDGLAEQNKSLPFWEPDCREMSLRWFKEQSDCLMTYVNTQYIYDDKPVKSGLKADDDIKMAQYLELEPIIGSIRSTICYKYMTQIALFSKSMVLLRRPKETRKCHLYSKGDRGLYVLTLPHAPGNETDSNGIPFVCISIHYGQTPTHDSGFINEEIIHAQMKVTEGVWITFSRPMRLNVKRIQILMNANILLETALSAWMLDANVKSVKDCKEGATMMAMMILSQHTRTCALLENLRYIFMDSTARRANLEAFLADAGCIALKNRFQVYLQTKSDIFARNAHIAIHKARKKRLEFKEDIKSLNWQSTGLMNLRIPSFLQETVLHNNLEVVSNEIFGLYFLNAKGLQDPHHRDIKLQTVPILWEMKIPQKSDRLKPFKSGQNYPQLSMDDDLIKSMAYWADSYLVEGHAGELQEKICNIPFSKDLMAIPQFNSTKACLKRGSERDNISSKVGPEFLRWREENPELDWTLLGFTLRTIKDNEEFVFGARAKGQRTKDDREFYVGSTSTFVIRTLEMTMRCLADLLTSEVISVGGDKKFAMMQDIINDAMRWTKDKLKSKAMVIKPEDPIEETIAKLLKRGTDQYAKSKLSSKAGADTQNKSSTDTESSSDSDLDMNADASHDISVQFINADRTKWSAADMTSKFKLFIAGLTTYPRELRSMMLYIIDMHMKKKFVMQQSVFDQLLTSRSVDERAKSMLQFMNDEKVVTITENWFQGMLNSLSSSFQACAERFNIFVFNKRLYPDVEGYATELIHSDDSCIITAFRGLPGEELDKYSDLFFKFDSEMGKAMSMHYNRKKTNLHSVVAEFLSTMSVWGHQTYPWYKVLVSIVAGLPGTGLADDMYACLSQLMSAGMKGAPMSLLTHVIGLVYKRVSELYGTNVGGHNDIEELFNIRACYVPLELGGKFLPSANLLCLAGPAIHDLLLCHLFNEDRLPKHLKSKIGKLLLSCSSAGLMSEDLRPQDAMEYDAGFSGPIFKQMHDHKDDKVKEKVAYLSHSECFTKEELMAWELGHPEHGQTFYHLSKDLMKSLHLRMQKHSYIRALAGSIQRLCEVQRARSVKGPHVKLKPWDEEWKTLREVFMDIKAHIETPITESETIVLNDISKTFAVDSNAYLVYFDRIILTITKRKMINDKEYEVISTMSQKLPFPAKSSAIVNKPYNIILALELESLYEVQDTARDAFLKNDMEIMKGKYVSPYRGFTDRQIDIYKYMVVRCRTGFSAKDAFILTAHQMENQYGYKMTPEDIQAVDDIHIKMLQCLNRISKAFKRKRADRYVITESGSSVNRLTLDRFMRNNTLKWSIVNLVHNVPIISWDLSTVNQKDKRAKNERHKTNVDDIIQCYRFTCRHIQPKDRFDFFKCMSFNDKKGADTLVQELRNVMKSMLERPEKYRPQMIAQVAIMTLLMFNSPEVAHMLFKRIDINIPIFVVSQQWEGNKWTGPLVIVVKSGSLSVKVESDGGPIRFASATSMKDVRIVISLLKKINKTLGDRHPEDMSPYNIQVVDRDRTTKRICLRSGRKGWFYGAPLKGDEVIMNLRRGDPKTFVTNMPPVFKLSLDRMDILIESGRTAIKLWSISDKTGVHSVRGRINIFPHESMVTKDGLSLYKLNEIGALVKIIGGEDPRMKLEEVINCSTLTYEIMRNEQILKLHRVLDDLRAVEPAILNFLSLAAKAIQRINQLRNQRPVDVPDPMRREDPNYLIVTHEELEAAAMRPDINLGSSITSAVSITESSATDTGVLSLLVLNTLYKGSMHAFNPYIFGITMKELLVSMNIYEKFEPARYSERDQPTSESGLAVFSSFCGLCLFNLNVRYRDILLLREKEKALYMKTRRVTPYQMQRVNMRTYAPQATMAMAKEAKLAYRSKSSSLLNEPAFREEDMTKLLVNLWNMDKIVEVEDDGSMDFLQALGLVEDEFEEDFPVLSQGNSPTTMVTEDDVMAPMEYAYRRYADVTEEGFIQRVHYVVPQADFPPIMQQARAHREWADEMDAIDNNQLIDAASGYNTMFGHMIKDKRSQTSTVMNFEEEGRLAQAELARVQSLLTVDVGMDFGNLLDDDDDEEVIETASPLHLEELEEDTGPDRVLDFLRREGYDESSA